ncbi:MAG: ParA family protein [Polynucleobacter sp.]|nr:ParA family protein [Polynucleobacter sp.]
MHTISIMNAKGGVAKTTTALCLASYLATKGQRVLFMDLDPQSNATKTFLKLSVGYSAPAPTLYDVLYNYVMDSRKNIVATAVKEVAPNLFLLPASQRMEPFKDLIKSNSRRPLDVLKQIIKPLQKDFDYLIIDCPADLSVYVENAIEMSDTVLCPTTYDLYGLDGLSLVIPVLLEIKGDDFAQYRVLYTMHNARATKIQEDIGNHAKMLEAMRKVLPFKIPIDQSVKNSQAKHQDLISTPTYRNSQARHAYTKLGDYVLEHWS